MKRQGGAGLCLLTVLSNTTDMKPLVLAHTLRSIASKLERSASPSRRDVVSDLRMAYDSVRLSAAVEEVTEEEFRAAFQSTSQEALIEALGDEYPVTVDNLWQEYWELSNNKTDKKRAKKILKVLDL